MLQMLQKSILVRLEGQPSLCEGNGTLSEAELEAMNGAFLDAAAAFPTADTLVSTREKPVTTCTEDNQHEVLGPLSLLTILWTEDNCRLLQRCPLVSRALFLMYFAALEYEPAVRTQTSSFTRCVTEHQLQGIAVAIVEVVFFTHVLWPFIFQWLRLVKKLRCLQVVQHTIRTHTPLLATMLTRFPGKSAGTFESGSVFGTTAEILAHALGKEKLHWRQAFMAQVLMVHLTQFTTDIQLLSRLVEAQLHAALDQHSLLGMVRVSIAAYIF